MDRLTCGVLWLLPLLLLSIQNPAHAESITGSARVLDGDTISIGVDVIRLHGIDAPENGQNCKRSNGKSFNCGASAEKKLKVLTAGEVTCTGTSRDNYERLIAVCSNGVAEINTAMVLSGWALAYRKFSQDYIAEEDEAKAAERGLWAGRFESPTEFRANKWAAAAQEAPDSECPIKGNININSKKVKIYHAPWSRSYNRTRINTAKGERWFCTEAEALAAGWRAPLR